MDNQIGKESKSLLLGRNVFTRQLYWHCNALMALDCSPFTIRQIHKYLTKLIERTIRSSMNAFTNFLMPYCYTLSLINLLHNNELRNEVFANYMKRKKNCRQKVYTSYKLKFYSNRSAV